MLQSGEKAWWMSELRGPLALSFFLFPISSLPTDDSSRFSFFSCFFLSLFFHIFHHLFNMCCSVHLFSIPFCFLYFLSLLSLSVQNSSFFLSFFLSIHLPVFIHFSILCLLNPITFHLFCSFSSFFLQSLQAIQPKALLHKSSWRNRTQLQNKWCKRPLTHSHKAL